MGWGVVTWPDDPNQIWTNAATPADEPVVSPEIPAELLGPWSPPLTGPGFEPSEEALSEEAPDWSHQVDIEQSEENDAEEEAPAVPATDALSPVDEGAPPEGRADLRPDEPATESDGGEDGGEMVGDVLIVSEKVARALSRPPPYPALGPNDAAVRARLAAALVLARAQAEAAQAEVARMEAEEAQREAWTPAETLPASGDTARDRSRSARAQSQAERSKPTLTARAKTPSGVPAPPWSQTMPKPLPSKASPKAAPGLADHLTIEWVRKAKLKPGWSQARQPPIGAPPPQASAQEEEYEIVEDESPPVSPKAELRPAPAKRLPIGAPPPPAPDLELDPGAAGVGVHYPPRGWRILRDHLGEVNLDEVRPDIDDMEDDLAGGWTETGARRRWRDRIRAARHVAMKIHNWQIDQGIILPGPTRTPSDWDGGRRSHRTRSPPGCRPSRAPSLQEPPSRQKSPGGKGLPLDRSQTPAKSKGTGGKGKGKGGQSTGKGGKKGAHPGRGEHSRHVGYSEATSGAAPSTQFQESVSEGQAKGASPKGPPSTPGHTDASSGPVSAQGYMPESLRHLSPGEIDAERRIAEAFNAFLDAFPTPEQQPAASKPAPTAAAWKPHTPTMPSPGPVAPVPAPEPTAQVGAGAPAEAAEPDVDPAPVVEGEDEPATVGSYPLHYQPAAVTVLNWGIPPPPPPTAIVGRHVAVYDSGLLGINGESGHVTGYDSSIERYRVLLNNGHV